MRRSLFILPILFFACTNAENEPQAPDTTTPAETASKKTENTVAIAGYWVNEQYANEVKATKSPSKVEIPENSCIFIPAGKDETTRMIHGFHEGGADLRLQQNDAGYEFRDGLLDETRYSIADVSANRMKIGNEYFVRLSNFDEDGTSFPILEELLFEGSYKNEDGSTVRFNKDGTISGLTEFGSYSPHIYYTTGKIDLVELGKNKESRKTYGYRFNGNELSIYEVTCKEKDAPVEECEEIVMGKRIYQLNKL